MQFNSLTIKPNIELCGWIAACFLGGLGLLGVFMTGTGFSIYKYILWFKNKNSIFEQ